MAELHVNTKRKSNRYTNEDDEIIKKHYPISGYKGVLKLLPNRTQESIYQRAYVLGVSGTTNYFTKKEDDIIRKHYPGNGYEEVLKHIEGRDKDSIQRRASKLGVSFLTYDKNFFEDIDSEVKAYWLGFIYADGWVTTENRWGISLSSVDKGHLQKCLDSFNSNLKIRTRERITDFDSYKTKVCESSFMIKNSKMYSDLVKNGVLRNKTCCMKFPTECQVPKHLLRHFIRGFFDGDGSYVIKHATRVRKDRGNQVKPYTMKSVSLVCKQKSFIEGMSKELEKEGIDIGLYHTKRDDMYVLSSGKSQTIVDFLDYVYKDSSIYLDRKREKAQELREHCLSYLRRCESKA